jgi:hypothetical protein
MTKGNEEVMKIKWLLVDKQMVKFDEKEESFKLDDGVMKFIDRVKAGDTVKVGIKDDTVIFLQKEKKTEASTESSEQKEWTVIGMPKNKQAIKFAEQPDEKYWYPVDESIQKDFDSINKGDKILVGFGNVMVTSQAGKRYPKNGVVSVSFTEKPKLASEQTVDNAVTSQASVVEKTQFKTSSTNDSIEAQVALKEAGAIVRSFIETKSEIVNTVEKVESVIATLTKSFLDTLKTNK